MMPDPKNQQQEDPEWEQEKPIWEATQASEPEGLETIDLEAFKKLIAETLKDEAKTPDKNG
jgi:hypothetical protein